ncbi:MAG TPA: M1 family aminopeptidase [Flavobacterium sp.]|nr:M1 family aminopeptidase [Flavobacterium sp.]
MWEFIRFELKYWLKTPMIWIFFGINALIVFGTCASDSVQLGFGIGSVHKNAPYVIQYIYGSMSLVNLLMITAFMNATANRDFEYGMHQFVFSSPIKKRDYFFGKFIGAAIISVVPLLGVSLGALLAPIVAPAAGWTDASRYGDIIWSGHFMGILTFAIPNVIISGVLVYALAVLFRSNIISFIGSMLILVLYSVSSGFTADIQKEWLANLLDPFGFQPMDILSKYMTVSEKNMLAVPLIGDLLLNRLVWIGITILILICVYFKFSFNTKKEKPKKQRKEAITKTPVINTVTYIPTKANVFSWRIFTNLIGIEIKTVARNPTFIIIVSIGIINLIANITSFTSAYGSNQYPVTYDMISSIRGAFSIFLLAIIIFYTGVLVWKERDAKINEIQDAAPIKTGMLLGSKIIAMIVCVELVLVATMVIGIVAQTLYGFTDYKIDVYVKSLLVMDLFYFSFLIVLSILIHHLINNRYIAYFAFVVFYLVNQFIWDALDVSTFLVKFGRSERIIYSDMNGFGPFVNATTWYTIYWTLGCVLLAFVINAFYVRGKQLQFRSRIGNAGRQLRKNSLAVGMGIAAFVVCGGFIYYNTKVLNTYQSPDEQENAQVQYEKKYKKYENLVQPRYYKFDYKIDIDPAKRNLTADITAWAHNSSKQPISEIHFTMPTSSDSISLEIPDAKMKMRDNKLYYRIYSLNKLMMPNDSIKITMHYSNKTRGFENKVSFTSLTENGTFFNNQDITPSIGYNSNYELTDKNRRIKLKLPKRDRAPKLDDSNLKARSNNYLGSDSDWVQLNTTISTSEDQTAIAPGSLIKSWKSDGRNYFHYKLEQKSLNFYSFISARYEVAREKWNGIDLEVYYDKQHAYNVPNMMKSMRKSLEYYTAFGPYFHKQCRIVEFPRYASFAQSFPGTMPYSESIGFIIDLREVTKDDIDMVYYVVAHEMAHQYWAHQVIGANMQGSEMMSEGFAQYSALMVMEKEYGKDKMKKFLKYEMDDYLDGRSNEPEAERPLMKTESQQYIHYNKASVVMYYLKEMIGEQKVNLALQNLIKEFGYKEPPYATSNYAVREFRKVTPDSLKYLISDMFEKITLFNNHMLEAKSKKIAGGYEVTLKAVSEKFRADSLGKETKIPIADYIDIGIFAEPKGDAQLGKVLLKKRLKITKKENTFVFKTKELPYEAGIDPYNYLIDRIPDDNLKKLEE